MSILEVNHIEKHFGPTKVLNDISFSLEAGQALSIIGSSGSGKTTLLRCLNFLERPNGGTIAVNGSVIFDAADPSTQIEKDIREKRLHFGLVFQNFNLFPQYTALQNVTLARELRAKKKGGESREEILQAGLALLNRWGLQTAQTTILTSFPADSSSGSPLLGRWPCTLISSVLTNPPPPWTRNSPAKFYGSFVPWRNTKPP